VTRFSESTVFATSGCQSTKFAVSVGRFSDPLHARVVANSVVSRIDEDDFEILVRKILIDPVGVQDTEVSALASNTLLCNCSEVASWLLLVDTLVFGLSIDDTLAVGSLTSTTSYGDSINDESLFSFVSQTVSLLRSQWVVNAEDLGKLAIFPGSDTEEKPHSVRLLFTP
jgi:hypothetical protein